MSEAWYAAFAILSVLALVNAVVGVAALRQIGVLHERLPPVGPGALGPEPGVSFTRLKLEAVSALSSNGDGVQRPRASVVAYVTPGCSLCRQLPDFMSTYRRAAPAEVRSAFGFALATDAPLEDAQEYEAEHGGRERVPLLRHDRFARHYDLSEVGSPYVLALADGADNEQVLLAGGVVNAFEQLEDLMDMAVANLDRFAGEDGPGSRENLLRASEPARGTTGAQLETEDGPTHDDLVVHKRR